MKKFIFLILFFVPVFIFGQTITLDYIGMHGSGGTSDFDAGPNEGITVRVKYDAIPVSGFMGVNGVRYVNSSFNHKIGVFWYSSAVPVAVNRIGGTTVTVSGDLDFTTGSDQVNDFIFTLPTAASGALSFQIVFLIYGDDIVMSEVTSSMHTSYITDVWSPPSDNPPSGWQKYMTYTADTTTETPTMTLPADNQHDNNPTDIEFYLPEAGYDGSVKLKFTRTGENHICTIVSETQGTHSFSINPTSLSSASEIASVTGGNSLTANVAYTVTIEYQDVLQNAVASDSNTGYIYDTITETPTLDEPANLAVIDQSFSIVYDQPEMATDNTVKITFTGDSNDPTPHVLTVISEASGTDIHIAFDGSDLDGDLSEVTLSSGNNYLVSGAEYDIKIEYQDFLGNAVSYDINNDITYSTDAIIYASGGDYGAASFNPDSDNNPFFRFQLYWNNTGTQPSVTSIRFDILGTYSASDVKTNGMKLWRSNDNSFSAGSDTQIGSSIDIADPLIFSSLSETIPTTPGYYYFVTVDVSSTASGSDAIGAEIDQASHITTVATVSGTFPITGGEHPLPVTMSSFTAQFTNGNPTLYWTTQSETNNEGWNIYRGTSQNMGQTILVNTSGLILGQGTTSEPTDYIYTDQNGVVENTTYYYWLESVDNGGETEMFGPISLTIPLGGGNSGTPAAPDDYGLQQNYPNPFNPSTEIRFALEESSNVILTIYNTKGQKIQTLYKGNVPADIVKSVLWDGRDDSGKQVASGIYLYELRTKKETFIRKMILTK